MNNILKKIIEKRARKVWLFYKRVKTQSVVVRSGYHYYGVYDSDLPRDNNRSESILEHLAGACYLVDALVAFFPIITAFAGGYKRLIRLFHSHELGELETGDVPDAGMSRAQLEETERKAVKDVYKDFPNRFRRKTRRSFGIFQAVKRFFGKLSFFIDKLEAILQGFLYELQGRPGACPDDAELSDRDRFIVKMAGSRDLTAVWGANLVLRMRKYRAGKIVTAIIIAIINAASLDVRGEEAGWIEPALRCDFDPDLF